MEAVRQEFKEKSRVRLRESIINKSKNLEFIFRSRYDIDNSLFLTEDDRNRGKLVIKDLTNGKDWNATYYLTFFSGDICHLTIQLNDFLLKSNDLLGVYEANNISYRLDEMIIYITTKFPPLPIEKEIS
jgi:hypothetical protein